MKIVGLTGGIASGKSAAARVLRGAGVPVVDADELAREAVLPGTPGLADLVTRFGQEILLPDRTLDRKKLGALIFGDDVARRDLNAMTHPRIAALAMERLDALRSKGSPVAVYEVPLLFENGLEAMMDATLLIAASETLQLERLMKRDGLDESAARARIRAQMPLEEKRRRATRTIENNGSLDELAHQLRQAWRELTGEILPAP